MNRRDFLSMLSCSAFSAVMPKKIYFFLDGLWRAQEEFSVIYIAGGIEYKEHLQILEDNMTLLLMIEEAEVLQNDALAADLQNILHVRLEAANALPWFSVPNVIPDQLGSI